MKDIMGMMGKVKELQSKMEDIYSTDRYSNKKIIFSLKKQ